MGTWSTGSFGNDDALDWFGELREASEPLSFIKETMRSGSTEGTVAASAVLALLSGTGIDIDNVDVHPDVVDWCIGKPSPPESLRHAAVDAIQAIIDDPEADGHDTWAELGEDDEDYIAWLTNLRNIQVQLR